MKSILFVSSLFIGASAFGQVTLKKIRTIEQFHVTAAATAPTGALIAIASEDNCVRLLDAASGQTRFQMKGHPQAIGAVAFNRAGTIVASGDATARIYLWDTKTGKKIREFPRDKGHTKGIIGIAFNSDGSRVATVGNDDTIKIWKTSGGNPIGTILGSGANLYGIAYTSNGAILTGTLADGLRVYNGSNLQCVAKMPVPGGQGVNNIATNRDGSMAVTAGRDGKLMLWNVGGRKKVQTFAAHNDWIINTAVSPNGKFAASSSVDRTVTLWNLASGAKAAVLADTSPVGSPIGFTGDGKYFICTSLSDGLTIFSVTPGMAGSAKPVVVKKKKGR